MTAEEKAKLFQLTRHPPAVFLNPRQPVWPDLTPVLFSRTNEPIKTDKAAFEKSQRELSEARKHCKKSNWESPPNSPPRAGSWSTAGSASVCDHPLDFRPGDSHQPTDLQLRRGHLRYPVDGVERHRWKGRPGNCPVLQEATGEARQPTSYDQCTQLGETGRLVQWLQSFGELQCFVTEERNQN